MWVIILKSMLALVSIFTGGTIFYKYIKDNKILVFLAGSVSILSAMYLFIEIKKDIVKLNISKVEKINERIEVPMIEMKKEDIQDNATLKLKWITPSDSICEANGGKVDAGCYANWENAKKICSVNGGRLPTIDELKKVLLDCGGEIDNTSKNINNIAYQTCYKQKGFVSQFYWSSTTLDSNFMWYISFYHGYQNDGAKHSLFHLHCIREE